MLAVVSFETVNSINSFPTIFFSDMHVIQVDHIILNNCTLYSKFPRQNELKVFLHITPLPGPLQTCSISQSPAPLHAEPTPAYMFQGARGN